MKKRLIVRADSNSPDYDAGCEFCLIEVDEKLQDLVRRRAAMLLEGHAKDQQAWEMYFWCGDYLARWMSHPFCGEDGSDDWPRDAASGETFAEAVEDNWYLAPDDLALPDSLFHMTECGQMVLRADLSHDGSVEAVVAFCAIPKHSSIHVSSGPIPVAEILAPLPGKHRCLACGRVVDLAPGDELPKNDECSHEFEPATA
jgi:hypothetical protein